MATSTSSDKPAPSDADSLEGACHGIKRQCGTGYAEPDFAGWAHTVVDGGDDAGTIFLGPQQSAKQSSLLRRSLLDRNVTAIVNCTQTFPCHHGDIVEYCRVPVRDECGADILPYLRGAAAFIDAHVSGRRRKVTCSAATTESRPVAREVNDMVAARSAPGSVLVHCEMGVSRSATVVMAYLVQYRGMTCDEALSAVKSRRPQAMPNPGFWQQLLMYEKLLQSEREGGRSPGGMANLISLPGCDARDEEYLEWAKSSSAIYSTLGGWQQRAAPSPFDKNVAQFIGGNESLHLVFGDLSDITYSGQEHIQKLLNGAMDHVWSRGVLDVDLAWLAALCDALQKQCNISKVDKNTPGDEIKKAIYSMLKDGSEFCERWTGEVYPEQVQRIQCALSLP